MEPELNQIIIQAIKIMAQPSSDTLDIKPISPAGAVLGTQSNSDAAAARAKIAELPDPHAGYLKPGETVNLRNLTAATAPAQSGPVSPAANMMRPASPAQAVAAPQAKVAVPKLKRPGAIPSPIKPILSALGSFVLLLVVFKSQILFSQLKYLTKPAAQTTTANTTAAVTAAPTISIPKINVNAPVVYEPSVAEANVLKALESGIVHYGNTASPGQNGNAVFFGHSSNDWWEPGNYKFVFVLLDKLTVGDQFSINYQSHQYVYQVTNIKVVPPTDLSVLNQTTAPTATLITCTPPGTSWKRLVVQAKQISPAPTAATAPVVDQTTSQDQPTVLPSNAPGLTEQLQRAWHNITSGISGLFGHSTKVDSSNSNSTDSSATLPAAN